MHVVSVLEVLVCQTRVMLDFAVGVECGEIEGEFELVPADEDPAEGECRGERVGEVVDFAQDSDELQDRDIFAVVWEIAVVRGCVERRSVFPKR